jgi:hypothetical protein
MTVTRKDCEFVSQNIHGTPIVSRDLTRRIAALAACVADLFAEEIDTFVDSWRMGGGIASRTAAALRELARVKRAQAAGGGK